MSWLPAARAEVLKLALAEARISVASTAGPSLNVMLPVGFVPVTVAVKVTLCPLSTFVAEARRRVVVVPLPPRPLTRLTLAIRAVVAALAHGLRHSVAPPRR